MGVKRTSHDLDIFVGRVRSFEWFWSSSGEMPGLDAFEALNDDGKAAIIATFEHWGNLEMGKRVSDTRVNEEHARPKILAAKAGKHRFASLSMAAAKLGSYAATMRKQKLDKAGKIAVKLTAADKKEYDKRVSSGEYYERN